MCLFIIKFMFMNNSFFNNPYHKCLTWCQDCSSCVILLPEPPTIQTRPKKGRNLWGPTNIHIFWHDSWVIKVLGKYKRWFSATSLLFYGQEMISWNLHTWIKSSWPAIAEVTTANFFQLYLMMIILKDKMINQSNHLNMMAIMAATWCSKLGASWTLRLDPWD